MQLFNLWSKDHGVLDILNLTVEQWQDLQKAANFNGIADEIVSNEDGILYIISKDNSIHKVDPLKFVGVKYVDEEVQKCCRTYEYYYDAYYAEGAPFADEAPDASVIAKELQELCRKVL
jgi:uncharacterized protein (DUF608 family)